MPAVINAVVVIVVVIIVVIVVVIIVVIVVVIIVVDTVVKALRPLGVMRRFLVWLQQLVEGCSKVSISIGKSME